METSCIRAAIPSGIAGVSSRARRPGPDQTRGELAGPEAFRVDELARRVLNASDDPRQVTADAHARYFGAELDDQSLTPGDDARIASTRFENWLGQSAK